MAKIEIGDAVVIRVPKRVDPENLKTLDRSIGRITRIIRKKLYAVEYHQPFLLMTGGTFREDELRARNEYRYLFKR